MGRFPYLQVIESKDWLGKRPRTTLANYQVEIAARFHVLGATAM
jgi:hypothetical protein